MSADLHALLDTDPAAGLRGVAALLRERGEADPNEDTWARLADLLDDAARHAIVRTHERRVYRTTAIFAARTYLALDERSER